ASNPNLVFELHRSNQIRDGIYRISRQQVSDPECGQPRMIWTVRDITQQMLVDEARNSFVSLATHELRTPLGNIKAYAETLAIHEGIDVERQKEFCNIINAEATRLSRFVDEMLNISQIESGSMTLDRRECDLGRLLDDVVTHVRPQMEQKQITFEVKLPPKFPALKLDKDKFESALINLLGNAAKYTPEGRTVSFNVEFHGQQIGFSVSDSGIGISEEELPRIFEKFYRSRDERVRNIDGNGLGLSFTQEVVQLHGGRLSATSELNKGSKFTATIPLPETGDR
ncbi:MAG: hypothetical protein FJ267_13225, partial [Planctomycetes bacterium]|nr:hypothetical protein [Planctomycetota bacterium]